MTTPTRVAIPRAVATLLQSAVASLEVVVDRDRMAPLALADMPRVVVLTGENTVVEEYVGGTQLRGQVVIVECHDAVAEGDANGGAEDAAATLADTCRAALMAARTLYGACLGIEVDEDSSPPRVEIAEAVRGAVVVLRIVAYHT
jgi:hypothetical protein